MLHESIFDGNGAIEFILRAVRSLLALELGFSRHNRKNPQVLSKLTR
jgi:hypothetical protein